MSESGDSLEKIVSFADKIGQPVMLAQLGPVA